MIDYKLAKQLKEAGFPFKTSTIKSGLEEMRLAIPTTEKIIKYLDTNLYLVQFGKGYEVEWFFIPTLSELIEAIVKSQDEFFSLRYVKRQAPEAYVPLRRRHEIQEGNLWLADVCQAWTTAKFPEEAVLKFWLKLNEKTKG